eukprot:35408_1
MSMSRDESTTTAIATKKTKFTRKTYSDEERILILKGIEDAIDKNKKLDKDNRRCIKDIISEDGNIKPGQYYQWRRSCPYCEKIIMSGAKEAKKCSNNHYTCLKCIGASFTPNMDRHIEGEELIDFFQCPLCREQIIIGPNATDDQYYHIYEHVIEGLYKNIHTLKSTIQTFSIQLLDFRADLQKLIDAGRWNRWNQEQQNDANIIKSWCYEKCDPMGNCGFRSGVQGIKKTMKWILWYEKNNNLCTATDFTKPNKDIETWEKKYESILMTCKDYLRMLYQFIVDIPPYEALHEELTDIIGNIGNEQKAIGKALDQDGQGVYARDFVQGETVIIDLS